MMTGNLSRASLNDLRVGEKDLLQGLRPLNVAARSPLTGEHPAAYANTCPSP
jgi:hypothetical protein